jgi:N-carbamoylputrescine amidase
MKVTICQLHDHGDPLAADWQSLVATVQSERSELVLLPDKPFCPRFTTAARFDPRSWEAAIEAHDRWETRYVELKPAVVLGSRPIDFGNERYDEAFFWSAAEGLRGVHAQSRLQCEEGAWEDRWYHAAPAEFVPMQVGEHEIAFLIGAELHGAAEAQRYRANTVDILAVPRSATGRSNDAWLDAGREAALSAAAFVISSAHATDSDASDDCGWIISPTGEVLAITSNERPMLSLSLDLPPAVGTTLKRTEVRGARAHTSG